MATRSPSQSIFFLTGKYGRPIRIELLLGPSLWWIDFLRAYKLGTFSDAPDTDILISPPLV